MRYKAERYQEIRDHMKSVMSRVTDEDIDAAIEAGNEYAPDLYGRFPWDRSERRGKVVGLSKAGLGEFVYAVLSSGGEIASFFVMWPGVRNSAVFARVRLTMKQKEKLESETPYRFDPPPVLSLN